MGKPQAAVPPWHLWGNTQRITVAPNAFATPEALIAQTTLVRAQYSRPETWRFLMFAELISGPTAGVGEQGVVNVFFELMVGIGRSNIRIANWLQFQSFSWAASAPPLGLQHWTTNAAASGQPNRFFDDQVPQTTFEGQVFTDLIVADHITIVAHANFVTNIPNPAPVVLEVSGHVAPNTHIRPDWYEMEPVFSGETEGR